MNEKPMDQNKLLGRVRALDFAVIEAGLFLDTHPTDRRALAYFNEKRNSREAAYQEYVDTYGPLTLFDAGGADSWNWVDAPWPWEMEE